MKNRVAWGALLFVGTLCLSAGCTPAPKTSPPTPVTAAAKVRTDVAGLGRLVKLPRPALSAMWREQQIGDGNMGPSDLRVLAVIQFSEKDARQIEMTARKQGAARQEEIEVLPWFPASIRKSAQRSADGRLVWRLDKLSGSQFAHLSLSQGFVARVPNTSFFVLSLHSM